jgi:hypothetical protein
MTPGGNQHCQLVHGAVRRRCVAGFPLDHDGLFRPGQYRVEVAQRLMESILGRPLDHPPFRLEEAYEFVADRQDAISLSTPFSALRMYGERSTTDGPFASPYGVVNLLPGRLPVLRSGILSAVLERDDIYYLHDSSS